MAPVANKDAYYSVSIAGSHQKFLMFKWMKYYYIITVFPDGLTNCPRNSTNLLEPLSAKLRSNAHQSIAYIDDFYLQGDSLEECQRNVIETVELLTQLEFVIHSGKSVLHSIHRLM